MLEKTPEPPWAAKHPQHYALLKSLGLDKGATLEPHFDRGQIDRSISVQIRDSDHIAPKEGVQAIRAKLKAGTVLEPIIVTADMVLIDGNTRDAGCEAEKQATTPAIVLAISWRDADEATRETLTLLGASANASHGTGLTPRERIGHAERALKQGWTAQKIARTFSLKDSQIRSISYKLAGEQQLIKLGIDLKTRLDPAQLKALGTTEALGLNNEPFRQVAFLASAAGLNGPEVRDLVKEIKAAGADEAALNILKQRREDYEQRIDEHERSGNGTKPPGASQLRKALGFVAKHAGKESDLLETNRSKQDEYITLVEKCAAVLTRLVKLQRQRL
jgi:hypothetical protein